VIDPFGRKSLIIGLRIESDSFPVMKNRDFKSNGMASRRRHRISKFIRPSTSRNILFVVGSIFAWTAPASSLGGSVSLEEILMIDRTADGRPFRTPSSVVCDPMTDEILIVDTDAGQVAIFDRHGEMTGLLGKRGELRFPVGVAVGPKGTVYVSERGASAIKVFDGETGRQTGSFTEIHLAPDPSSSESISAGKMAVGPSGDLYVVDESGGTVRAFEPDGKLKFLLWNRGEAGKGFPSLRDVVVDPLGAIYTASRGLDPLNLFDRKGRYLHPVRDQRLDVEDVSDPVGIAVDGRNRLWVLDGAREDLRVYDPSGQHLQTIREDDIPGRLFFPVDIEIDRFDDILILERGAGRLRKFTPGT
jgi:DNA-binding beta-propeller fold protein YncE